MPFDIGCYRKCSHALENMVQECIPPVVKWYMTIVYGIVWIGLLYIGCKAIVNYD